MFKEENRIWWYMVGVVVLLVMLFIFGRDYALPIIRGQKTLYELEPYTYSRAPEFTIDNSQDYYLDLRTNYGTITVDLFEKSAPNNVNNVVFLTGRGYYNGTKFFRLFRDFMVQGGDRNTLDDEPQNDGLGGPGYFVDDEVNWESLGLDTEKQQELALRGYSSEPLLSSKHLAAFSMAMASTAPDSNGSQFFIVLADPSDPRLAALDGYFTVVGRVYAGADVLERIKQIPVDTTDSNMPRPQEDIVLEEATVRVLGS